MRERSDGSDLAAFFDPGGILSRELTGYEPRPGQKEMAEAVRQTCREGRRLLVEAGTGTGKTLAYLVGLLAAGVPAVISTGTRALQEQLFHRDLPFLDVHHPARFSYCYLKGRANYLCRNRLRQALAQPALAPAVPTEGLLEEIEGWSRETEQGDLAELSGLGEEALPLQPLAARRETCLGSRCPFFAECFVTRARQRALGADLVVVNHHLLFADLAVREGGFGQVIPPYRYLLLDEAHLAEDVAVEHLGVSLGRGRLEDLAGDAGRLFGAGRGRKAARGRAAAARLREEAELFFTLFTSAGAGTEQRGDRFRLDGRRLPAGGGERGEALGRALTRLAGACSAAGGAAAAGPEEARALADRCLLLRGELEFLLRLEDPDFVYWCERRGGGGAILRAAPVAVAGILRERLFDCLEAAILTSATLAVAGELGFIRDRLGVGECRPLRLPSPFPYAEQAVLYVPEDLPEPTQPDFIELAAKRMAELLTITRGRAFLLFTSFQNLRRARALLAGRLPFPLLVQGEMPRRALLEEFRAAGDAVLLATRGFWQGVDVRGPALSAVVVDRLPFEVPSEPLVQARLERIRLQGGDPFLGYQVPAAVIELKQGLGRLIRSAADFGLLAVLDTRLRRRGYGRLFLESLPPFPLTSRLADVDRFFRLREPGRAGGPEGPAADG